MAASKKPSQAYKGNGKHSWEEVTPGLHSAYSRREPQVMRLRVIGGYLYRALGCGAPVFVPMPEVVKHKV